nr:MAG TPA: transposase [Caudoviricetes sp.]
MEYYNNILCMTAGELTAVMTPSNYKQLSARGKITVARRACRGHRALVVVDSLPSKYREKVKEIYPEGSTMKLHECFRENFTLDAEARTFFSTFRFDNGSPLPADKVNEYTVNASAIRAVLRLMANTKSLRRAQFGGRVQWDEMAAAVAYFKQEYGHTLPESTLRLRKKVAQFNREGYACLISGKFQNQNTRRVNYRTERLILSLDCQPERPFNTTTHEMYLQFVCGELDVYDPETGELFDPEDFTDKNGEPIMLSEATIRNYLNNPKNRALRAKYHDSAWKFNNEYRPHHNRKAAGWAFSKVSLDDRDLPRKMADGNRVKAYYAYDVASGCVVGYAYNRLKTADLFLDCVRNMFQLIDRQGWNCPAEVEVEHHLVGNFADGLMRAGVVFPFVRWCNPGNSQEKRAEHFNRAKKYGVEKRSQVGIGRWYARLEANRPKVEKIYDEFNNTYKEATYTYEQLVAEDIRAIATYNNQLHPNQTMYPGLTRWQVLCENQNPNLSPVDKALLYRFIGERTRTSIRRNMYCTVRGVKFGLPSPELIGRLAPNDYAVEAFYMPDAEGNVSEVYLYQGNNFIATCAPIGLYNEATAERTGEDVQNYLEQSKYVAQFDAMIRREKIQKVKLLPCDMPTDKAEVVEAAPVIPAEDPDEFEFDIDYAQKAKQDL